MIPTKKRLVFLSDNPPLRNKGFGISVLLFNLLMALQDNYNLSVITFCVETTVNPSEITKDNEGKDVFICDRYYLKLYRILRFGILKKPVQFISFLLSLPKIIKKYNNSENAIITIVGANVRPVYKAWILMKLAKKTKHYLYVVDDLELINHRRKNKIETFLISIFLKRTIVQSDVLICISEGLKDLYKEKYNKDSITLLPNFKKLNLLNRPLIKNDNEFIFLFTGGLSFLYNSSLKIFASIIEELNMQNDIGKTLKLVVQTYTNFEDFKALGFNTNYVSYSTNNNRDELLKVYEKCDCFLVPYSFDKSDKGMVITSFPQKTAEIIQYGKPVLVFGPDYGSVVQFFQKNELSYICTELFNLKIKQTILKIIEDYKTFNANVYIDAYDKYLSSNMVYKVFQSVLKK